MDKKSTFQSILFFLIGLVLENIMNTGHYNFPVTNFVIKKKLIHLQSTKIRIWSSRP